MLTQLFQPEPNHLKGLAFAEELMKHGHRVEVLTGFPNYPEGCVYPGYSQALYLREEINGVPIVRVPLYASHDSSGFRRFLNYSSFMLTACFPGLVLIKKPNLVHVYMGPATLALAAMIMKILAGVPYILDIQDLWPDSVTSSGMLKIPGGRSILDLWCRLSYRHAEKIVVLSPGYKKMLLARGVPPSKVEIIYNWCDERAIANSECREKIRKRFSLNGHFNIVYAGNIGHVQALGSVLEAAKILKKRNIDIQFVFIGDGADTNRLERMADEAELTNVCFFPRQTSSVASSVIAAADAVLVHLRDNDLGRIGIPQKTQTYMASGRPVLLAMKGDAADMIRHANAGIVCDPENPGDIAYAAEALFNMPYEKRESLGRNGRAYYEEHFSFRIGVQKMARLFDETAK